MAGAGDLPAEHAHRVVVLRECDRGRLGRVHRRSVEGNRIVVRDANDPSVLGELPRHRRRDLVGATEQVDVPHPAAPLQRVDRGLGHRVLVHPEEPRRHMRDPVRRGEDVLPVLPVQRADRDVVTGHRRHARVGVLDRPVELVDVVGQRRDVRARDRLVLQPDRLELVLDAGVGGRADEERVDVIVTRDPGVAEPLQLVERDLRDAARCDVEDRRVVREVDQRRRRDRRQRIVGRHERHAPRPVGVVVVLGRVVQRNDRRPDVLRDRDRLLERVRPVEARRRLRRIDRRQRRLTGRRRRGHGGTTLRGPERIQILVVRVDASASRGGGRRRRGGGRRRGRCCSWRCRRREHTAERERRDDPDRQHAHSCKHARRSRHAPSPSGFTGRPASSGGDPRVVAVRLQSY